MMPMWVVEAAERFWRDAGMSHAPFPRDIQRAVLFSGQLIVVEIPGLTLAAIREWTQRRNIHLPIRTADRPVRGAMVARCGNGVMFIDADDSLYERRFTIAHELAHFLRDHLAPREKASHGLGPRGVLMVDGDITPTPADDLQALLMRIELESNVHLLDREHNLAAIETIEDAADQLAIELLAPTVAVNAEMQKENGDDLVTNIQERFAVPRWVAQWLCRHESPNRSRLFQMVDDLLRRNSNQSS